MYSLNMFRSENIFQVMNFRVVWHFSRGRSLFFETITVIIIVIIISVSEEPAGHGPYVSSGHPAVLENAAGS